MKLKKRLVQSFILISLVLTQFNISLISAETVKYANNYQEFKTAFTDDTVDKIVLNEDITYKETLSRKTSLTIVGNNHKFKMLRVRSQYLDPNIKLDEKSETNPVLKFENIQFDLEGTYFDNGFMDLKNGWTLHLKNTKTTTSSNYEGVIGGKFILNPVDFLILEGNNEYHMNVSLEAKNVVIKENAYFKVRLASRGEELYDSIFSTPSNNTSIKVEDNVTLDFSVDYPAWRNGPLSNFDDIKIGDNVTWSQRNFRHFINPGKHFNVKIGDNFILNYTNSPENAGELITLQSYDYKGFYIEVGKNFKLATDSQIKTFFDSGDGAEAEGNNIVFDEGAEINVGANQKATDAIILSQYSTITFINPEYLNLEGSLSVVNFRSNLWASLFIKNSPISLWEKDNLDSNSPNISKNEVTNFEMTSSKAAFDGAITSNLHQKYNKLETIYKLSLDDFINEKIQTITNLQNDKITEINNLAYTPQANKEALMNDFINQVTPLVEAIKAAPNKNKVLELYDETLQLIQNFELPDELELKKQAAKDTINNAVDQRINEINTRDDISASSKTVIINTLNTKRKYYIDGLELITEYNDIDSYAQNAVQDINGMMFESDLSSSKQSVKDELSLKANTKRNTILAKDDLSEEGKGLAIKELNTALSNVLSDIDNASTYTDLNTLVNKFKINHIENVITSDLDEGIHDAKEELVQAVSLKRNAINNKADLSDEGKQTLIKKLEKELETALTLIDSATNYTDLDTTFITYRNNIQSIVVQPDIDEGKSKAKANLVKKANIKRSAILSKTDLSDEGKEVKLTKLDKALEKTLKDIDKAITYKVLNNVMNLFNQENINTTIDGDLEETITQAKNELIEKVNKKRLEINSKKDLSKEGKIKTLEVLENKLKEALSKLDKTTSYTGFNSIFKPSLMSIDNLLIPKDLEEGIEKAKESLNNEANTKRQAINKRIDLLDHEKKDAIEKLDAALSEALDVIESSKSYNTLNSALSLYKLNIEMITPVSSLVKEKEEAISDLEKKVNLLKAFFNTRADVSPLKLKASIDLLTENLEEAISEFENAPTHTALNKLIKSYEEVFDNLDLTSDLDEHKVLAKKELKEAYETKRLKILNTKDIANKKETLLKLDLAFEKGLKKIDQIKVFNDLENELDTSIKALDKIMIITKANEALPQVGSVNHLPLLAILNLTLGIYLIKKREE